MPITANSTSGYVGQSIRRKEDARLVRGKGKFVDDIKLLGMLHLVFVRSPYAHATITSVDVAEAEALPGVVCTLTGAGNLQAGRSLLRDRPFAQQQDSRLSDGGGSRPLSR